MGEMTNKRCMTLLRNVTKNASIYELLRMGFTASELVEHFYFDRNDVRDTLIDLQDGEITFRSLYNVVGFTGGNVLKCIEGFDWAIGTSDSTNKIITFYNRVVDDEERFIKRLELHFTDPNTVQLVSFAAFKRAPVRDKTIIIDTPVRDSQWTINLLGHFETEWNCAEAIAHYTELLQKIRQEGE